MSEYLDFDEGSGLCPILSTTVLYFYCSDLIVSEVAQLCPTLCDPMDCIAYQAPPSMGFSRQEYWSRLAFPSPGGSSQPRD